VDDASPAVVETSGATEEVGALCGLDGCENPLPPPALDEHGRRKGGRPSRYCSKAHADAASRARRTRDTAAVSDPLSEVRSIGTALLPGIRELLDSLAALQQRFADAEQQAFAQVAHAETEAVQAREEAADATTRADQAQRQRREALAQARDHQRERDHAVQDADRIKQEADQVRTQAWEAVAAHERVRGQAEAAHAAANTERDRLAAELRAVRAQVEHDRAEHARLANALTGAQASLTEAHRELTQLRQESAQLRDESGQARQQLSALQGQLCAEREQGHRSQARARELEIELRATRDRLTEANSRVDTLIAASTASSAGSPQPVSATIAPPLGAPAARHPIWLGRPASRPASSRA
jgi:DNA repair exonuclease SbcCD ATPase subunit